MGGGLGAGWGLWWSGGGERWTGSWRQVPVGAQGVSEANMQGFCDVSVAVEGSGVAGTLGRLSEAGHTRMG